MDTIASASSLVRQWRELAANGMRRREAAATIGTTEAELVAALTTTGEALRLAPEWAAILECVPALGPVMALTRNDGCVIEKTGVYGTPEFANAHLGQVTGPDIDLRLFLSHWAYGFALLGEERFNLEFFGPDGNAVHKIISREQSDRDAFARIVNAFTADTSHAEPLAITRAAPAWERADQEVDLPAYHAALAAMTNTHDFFGVMRRFKLTREQALRLGGRDFAVRVEPQSYRALLQGAAKDTVPIMAFVGNDGCIEIHTGPVQHVVEHSGYFNVLDRTFNLHLLERAVVRAWITRKPTRDGIISSLEVYDTVGNLIVQFFGERHGGPERKDWRALLATLPAESSVE